MWGWSTVSRSASSVMAFTAGTSSRRLISTRTTPLAATQYLLRYEYVPDILEKRAPHREGHLGLAQQLTDEGKCLAGGPVGPVNMQVPTGALFIFADEPSAKLFTEQDPYVEAGLVTNFSIEEWNVVIEKKE